MNSIICHLTNTFKYVNFVFGSQVNDKYSDNHSIQHNLWFQIFQCSDIYCNREIVEVVLTSDYLCWECRGIIFGIFENCPLLGTGHFLPLLNLMLTLLPLTDCIFPFNLELYWPLSHIESLINKIKNNKSSGLDNITSENSGKGSNLLIIWTHHSLFMWERHQRFLDLRAFLNREV